MEKEKEEKPDDKGSIHVEGHILIKDPETGEVILDQRG